MEESRVRQGSNEEKESERHPTEKEDRGCEMSER